MEQGQAQQQTPEQQQAAYQQYLAQMAQYNQQFAAQQSAIPQQQAVIPQQQTAAQPAPQQQTPEQQQAAYQQYLAQLAQYNQQFSAPQQPAIPQAQAAPGYPPQQYYQQQQYPPQYQQQQQYPQQNRNYQKNAQHSDRVLWVGNLHQEVDENELRETFQQFGNIENIKLVQTKACGFITYSDAQSATRAHTEMNHKQIHGQEIKIGWGKAENPGGGYGQQFGGGGGGGGGYNNQRPHFPDMNKELPQMAPSRALWIGNVTQQLTETTLRELFSPFGSIESVRMMTQKNCAFIQYSSIDEATVAKKTMDQARVVDTQIRVNYGKA